ncbi:MAG TPA: hypothetical protein VJB69_00935 [Candidatus Paceibacterota bacterium]
MSELSLKVKGQKLEVPRKEIKKLIARMCSICGKDIKVIVYKDKTYRGGYYFFNIPLSTKKEREKARRAGTRTEMMGGREVQVMRQDPKPYAYVEYWECSPCFRGGKVSDPPKPVLVDKKNMVKGGKIKRT